tara:strand:+ start:261 stop:1475 length:1215 start_codon:yes stop_codon:yes gene_type:complete
VTITSPAHKTKKTIFERNPKITILSVITISALILDVVLTNIFSLYTAVKYDRPNILTSPPVLGVKHEIYHHDLMKNGLTEQNFKDLHGEKVQLHTNSLGFKDKSSRTVSLLPTRDIKKRIVFIGDSFTNGFALEYEDTFVGIIDKELNKRSIEVLNAGVASYSPIIYWRKIKYLIEDVGLRFDEVVVYIDISDAQDEASYYELSDDGNERVVYRKGQKRYGRQSRRDYFRTLLFKNSTFMYHTLNLLHDSLYLSQKEKLIEQQMKVETGKWHTFISPDYTRDKWTVDKNIYNAYGKNGIELMVERMNRLLNLLRDNSIDLTIAVYPWVSQVWFEDLSSMQVDIWERWAKDNNVRFINHFPDFVKIGSSKSHKLETLQKFYFPHDVHFNREGNRALARRFIKAYS